MVYARFFSQPKMLDRVIVFFIASLTSERSKFKFFEWLFHKNALSTSKGPVKTEDGEKNIAILNRSYVT